MILDFDLDLFKHRLAETVAWCVPRFSMDDLENCLRTPPIYPKGYMCYDDMNEIERFADIVFAKRANAISIDTIENIQDSLLGGRLLILDFRRATDDGTSSPETHGFINGCDISAWDSWVYLGIEIGREDPYLISSIPPEILHMVDSAIHYNATECIQWIDKSDFGFGFLDLLRS